MKMFERFFSFFQFLFGPKKTVQQQLEEIHKEWEREEYAKSFKEQELKIKKLKLIWSKK